MIKHLKNLYFLSLPLLFISCDPCRGSRVCADTFSFKIVDNSTGQDMVFGSPSIYSSDSVYLLTNRPGYSGNMSRVDNKRFVTTILLPIDTFFLRLTFADTDTLFLSYDYVQTKCCNYSPRGFGRLQRITYNQNIALQVGDTYILKK